MNRPEVNFPPTPKGTPRRRAPQWASDRERVVFYTREDSETGCWVWGTHIMPNGYGRLGRFLAHRLSYEAFVGPIPAGLVLDHLCRNRSCCNPDHLEPVTQYENVVVRGVTSVSHINALKTHCINDHEFTAENTYISIRRTGVPRRHCRTCRQGVQDRRPRKAAA